MFGLTVHHATSDFRNFLRPKESQSCMHSIHLVGATQAQYYARSFEYSRDVYFLPRPSEIIALSILLITH